MEIQTVVAAADNLGHEQMGDSKASEPCARWVLTSCAILVIRFFTNVKAGTVVAATSAVTTLVLGLALQPILGNFFAGVVISLERPFRINDWIKVGEAEGRAVEITWRTTHLRTR